MRRPRLLPVLLLIAVGACSDPVGPEPGLPPDAPPPIADDPAVGAFPGVAGPARLFVFSSTLGYPVSSYTRQSRFVLYDDGTFALQTRGSSHEYRGVYEERNDTLSFVSPAPGTYFASPWGATGVLDGLTMAVRYDRDGWFIDLENALYVLEGR